MDFDVEVRLMESKLKRNQGSVQAGATFSNY